MTKFFPLSNQEYLLETCILKGGPDTGSWRRPGVFISKVQGKKYKFPLEGCSFKKPTTYKIFKLNKGGFGKEKDLVGFELFQEPYLWPLKNFIYRTRTAFFLFLFFSF